MIFGIGFPPVGFIVGPLVGAFLGEIIGGQGQQQGAKSSMGFIFWDSWRPLVLK